MSTAAGGAALQIWLGRTEKTLRERLDQGDMPFLGLYTDQFSAQSRGYLRLHAIRRDRPVESFVRGLEQWPATFAIYLTIHVVEGYGSSGDAEVYAFVCTALGVDDRDLTATEREKLWHAYRRACVTLGLPVLPIQADHQPMVREYLHQAGVPIRYLGGLMERFGNLSDKLGCPDADDPELLQVWCEQLDLALLQKPVQRAIETDQSAYYARLFLRVRTFQTEDECATETERCAFRSIRQTGARKTYAKSAVPELQWRDGEIGVLLPAGSDRQWTIRVSEHQGEPATLPGVPGDEDPRFIPCEAALPKEIEVTARNLRFALPVWESSADNQILVFNRSGRLVCRARLGGAEVNLSPGRYLLVLRWCPPELVDSTQRVGSDVAPYECALDVVAGQALELCRGPARLAIRGRLIPSIEWLGTPCVGMSGREVYPSHELGVRVSVPREVIDAATRGLEVVVRHSGGKETAVPLSDPQAGESSISLADVLQQADLGLGRVTIRLRRPDIPNRPLASISGLVWNGLVTASVGAFRCVSAGAFGNLKRQYCENVKVDGASLTYADGELRYFRTVFELPSGEAVAHKWLVPGIFLVLEEPGLSGGAAVERPIAKGSVLQVRLSSRQRLKIYSSDDGVLTLGAFVRRIHSALLGGTQLYLATLVEHLSPEHQYLRLRLAMTSMEVDLVRLITPHQVVAFDSRRSGDEYVLAFSVIGQLQQIQIRAEEVLSGEATEITVVPDAVAVSGGAFAKAALTTAVRDNRLHAELRFPLIDWALGAWVFHIQAKIDGRWGKLVNQRSDVFTGSALLGPEATQIGAVVAEAPIGRRLEIFTRLVELSLECYAIESWRDLNWLDKEWDALAASIEPEAPSQVGPLLGLALRDVPETSSLSWVPLKSVSARFLSLYALPMDAYTGLRAGGGVTRSLLGKGEELGQGDAALFQEGFLDSFLILGFLNGARLARAWEADPTGSASDEPLRDFVIDKYIGLVRFMPEVERRRVLENSDWVPAPGDFLGLRHYWWAVKQLTEGLHRAQVGNDQRKGKALKLASRVAIVKAAGISAELSAGHLAARTSLGLMVPLAVDHDTDQDTQNIADLVGLISVVAYVARLDVRRPGILGESLRKLRQLIDTEQRHLESVLGFVLYIGVDLFVFYLALWELAIQRDWGGTDKS